MVPRKPHSCGLWKVFQSDRLRRIAPGLAENNSIPDCSGHDVAGSSVHGDHLRAKKSCDAGRRNGKRNGIGGQDAPLNAADVQRVGQMWIQDAEAGAVVIAQGRSGCCAVGAAGWLKCKRCASWRPSGSEQGTSGSHREQAKIFVLFS